MVLETDIYFHSSIFWYNIRSTRSRGWGWGSDRKKLNIPFLSNAVQPLPLNQFSIGLFIVMCVVACTLNDFETWDFDPTEAHNPLLDKLVP